MKQNLIQLSSYLSVTGEISPSDLLKIKQFKFRSLICDRPDAEGGEEQPSHSEILLHAESLGLTVDYLPVTMETLDQNATAFASLLKERESPILAYCRTGIYDPVAERLTPAPSQPTYE